MSNPRLVTGKVSSKYVYSKPAFIVLSYRAWPHPTLSPFNCPRCCCTMAGGGREDVILGSRIILVIRELSLVFSQHFLTAWTQRTRTRKWELRLWSNAVTGQTDHGVNAWVSLGESQTSVPLPQTRWTTSDPISGSSLALKIFKKNCSQDNEFSKILKQSKQKSPHKDETK